MNLYQEGAICCFMGAIGVVCGMVWLNSWLESLDAASDDDMLSFGEDANGEDECGNSRDGRRDER